MVPGDVEVPTMHVTPNSVVIVKVLTIRYLILKSVGIKIESLYRSIYYLLFLPTHLFRTY